MHSSGEQLRRRPPPGRSPKAEGKRPDKDLSAQFDEQDKIKKRADTHGFESVLNDFDSYAKRTQNTLESWFGIRDAPPVPSSAMPTPSQPLSKAPSPNHFKALYEQQESGSTLVYLHQVSPEETLAGISLKYGIEPSYLRRVNKLWAGDKPQMRGTLLVPVEACSKRLEDATGEADDEPFEPGTQSTTSSQGHGIAYGFWSEERGLIREAPSGDPQLPKLSAPHTSALHESDLRQHERITSIRSSPNHSTSLGTSVVSRSHASSSAAGSSLAATKRSEISRVPREDLKFFTSSGNGRLPHAPTKGSTGFGESGLDDLLQLSHERTAAAAPKSSLDGLQDGPDVSLPGPITKLFSDTSGEDCLSADARSETGTSYSDRLAEEKWKPNKWTLGGKSSASRRSAEESQEPHPATSPNNGLRPLRLVASRSNSNFGASREQPERASSGWNDAPPAGAIIADAYSGKRKKATSTHHRLLNDLAAGVQANDGPARVWQRPIDSSLPPLPPGLGPPARRQTEAGFGKLLSDAITGRVSVEGTLEAMYEKVAGKTTSPPPSSADALPPRRPNLRANASDVSRVSAEEARASLSSRSKTLNDFQEASSQANGVPLGQLSQRDEQYNGSSVSRARPRTGLKDVEWHRE